MSALLIGTNEVNLRLGEVFPFLYSILSSYSVHVVSFVFPGTKVQVRCMKLLKPYSKKDIIDDEEDKEDEDDEDETRVRRRHVPAEGRIMEKDMLSQAYHIGMSLFC